MVSLLQPARRAASLWLTNPSVTARSPVTAGSPPIHTVPFVETRGGGAAQKRSSVSARPVAVAPTAPGATSGRSRCGGVSMELQACGRRPRLGLGSQCVLGVRARSRMAPSRSCLVVADPALGGRGLEEATGRADKSRPSAAKRGGHVKHPPASQSQSVSLGRSPVRGPAGGLPCGRAAPRRGGGTRRRAAR